MHFICMALHEKINRKTTCCIATDSKLLYDHLQRNRANLYVGQADKEYLQYINTLNIHIVHINRSQNGEADSLPKEGTKRLNML